MPHRTSTPTSVTRTPVPLTIWPHVPPAPGSLADRSRSPRAGALDPHVVCRLIATYTGADGLVIDLDAHPATTATADWIDRYAALVITHRDHPAGPGTPTPVRLFSSYGERATTIAVHADQLADVLHAAAGTADLIITRYPHVDADITEPIDLRLLAQACAVALRPGGVLAVTVAHVDASGRFADHASHAVTAAKAAGLVYHQHLIAIDEPLREPPLEQRVERPDADACRDTDFTHRRQHTDLLIFTTKEAINV
jgi:hypothetical protein